jgi:hypothetical protein
MKVQQICATYFKSKFALIASQIWRFADTKNRRIATVVAEGGRSSMAGSPFRALSEILSSSIPWLVKARQIKIIDPPKRPIRLLTHPISFFLPAVQPIGLTNNRGTLQAIFYTQNSVMFLQSGFSC